MTTDVGETLIRYPITLPVQHAERDQPIPTAAHAGRSPGHQHAVGHQTGEQLRPSGESRRC